MQFAVKQGADRWAVAVCLITTVLALPVHSHAADFAFGDVRDPVRRCEMAGFIALPSSDVCLRVGGHVRMVSSAVEDDWNGNNDYYVRNIAIGGYTVPPSGLLPQVNFEFQDSPFNMYAQGRLHLDARLATDYGTVRAFIEGQAEDNDARTGGPFNLRHALVQFGNWTLGKTWSTFIDRDARVRRADPYKVVGDNGRSMRRNQIRYTQEFGGGFSVALAAEDQNYNTPPSAVVGVGPFVPITSPATTAVSVVNDRNNMPDLVATLRWEVEEVGSVQLSGALHQNRYAEL